MNDRVLMLAFGALTALATAGWMRPSAPAVTAQIPWNSLQLASTGLQMPMAESLAVQTAGYPVRPTLYGQNSLPARTHGSAVTAQKVSGRMYDRSPLRNRRVQPAYDDIRGRDAYHDGGRTIVRQRSKAKSAAIIGGGAAAGAAVGAIAGGGKGAVIGAAAGGGAGLVYDRMTHKKRRPADEVYGYRGSSYDPDDDRVYRDNRRSTMERIGIIGGGAAAGAAIGGMAGGGKGAAIGAVTGGAAGAIYDHVTKNR